MAKTISMSVGRVAIMHDIRAEYSANVDPTRTHNNEIFVDRLKAFNYDIEAYTNNRFQHAIDTYNAKQRREDRKKNKPYTELLAEENAKLLAKAKYNREHGINTSVRKPTKLAHEYVLQIGDKNTNGALDPNTDMKANREYARQVVEEIQRKYPHANILLATYHADEATPHLHLLIQFVGDDYKQGLPEQISMSKALEQDGFERSQNRGNYAINRFVEDIKDTIMTDKLAEIMHEERDIIGEHRKHEATAVFREKARAEEKHLKEVGAFQMQKLQIARQNLETKRNEYQHYYSSVANRLNKGIEELNASKNILESQKAEFESYKALETQALQEKNNFLDKKEKQLDSFANRASELFCDAQYYVDKAKTLYEVFDAETKARYRSSLTKLDESLLPHRNKQKEKQMCR